MPLVEAYDTSIRHYNDAFSASSHSTQGIYGVVEILRQCTGRKNRRIEPRLYCGRLRIVYKGG
jgi:hypothetical protein